MALNEHNYAVEVRWTGNRGSGTSGYREYGREHVITAAGVTDIAGSADPTFHGNKDRWNPELLLLAALAECHMLSYLHVAVSSGVVVTDYTDAATGSMVLNRDGSGQFTEAVLRPRIILADPAQAGLAATLHAEAAAKCFIARSVNFPVRHEPTFPGA